MRILVITHLFPYEEDTSNGVFIARHLAAIQRQGHVLEIYVPLIWSPKIYRALKNTTTVDHTRRLCSFDGLDASAIPYKRAPGRWFTRWDGLTLYYQMRRRILLAHRQKPYDVVYGICWIPECDVAVRLSRLLQIPALGYAIGSDINLMPNYSRAMYRHTSWIANSLNATQAMGQAVAEKIDAMSDKRTLEVAGVVDLVKFSPVSDYTAIRNRLGIPSSTCMVLFVGHLVKAKGVYELIEAICQLRNTQSNILLRICGNGIEHHRLSKLIKDRNAEATIQLVGLVRPDQMHELMQASNLFVLPSYSEGMPNVVMEAMACGLPVVATTVGGLPAALQRCEGAILVPPRDIPALQEAIKRVLTHSELRHCMSQAARAKAEASFGAEPNARRVIAHLNAAVEQYRDNKTRQYT